MPGHTLLHLLFTAGEVGINMSLLQEKKLRLTEVIQLGHGGTVIRTSASLGLSMGKSGSLGTVWLKQLPLLRDAPRQAARGPQMPSSCAGGCRACPLRGPPALPRAVSRRCVQAHGAVLGLRAPAAAQLQHHLPGAAEHPKATSVRLGPLLKPVASVGKTVPPPHFQLTPRDGSSRSWTPATGICAAGGDAAPCLLCIPVPARPPLPGRSNKTTCACQVLFGMCAPLESRS